MSIFGQVLGNLPLLHLSPQKLSKLHGQPQWWDFQNQLRHNCIRQAWLQSERSDHSVRQLLDLAVGRAYLTCDRARGVEPIERFLDMDMEHARRENEWWTCFGFFLEGEVQHLIANHHAGPILRSLLPPDKHSLGCFLYSGVLKGMLDRCQEKVRADALSRDTVQFVQKVTGRSACLEALPTAVSVYFNLADLVEEVIDAEVKALSATGPALPPS